MAHIIAIANHKGGVGKTTSTLNIGAGLARKGLRCLLVDLDPQANLSDALGYEDVEVSVYDAITEKRNDLPIIQIGEGLDLAPSNLDLSVAEVELSGKTGREYFLKDLLEKVKSNYDYILIDCPPSLGLLTINALTACHEVYIPLDSQYFSLKGLDKLTTILEQVQKRLNPTVAITGVFMTQFDTRTVVNRNIAAMVKQEYGSRLFSTRIRKNIALVEAPIQKLDIFSYDSKSNGAADYLALTEEIIAHHA